MLAVPPLSAAEAQELAARLLEPASHTPERAAAIARESGGNPMFVKELARFRDAGGGDARALGLDEIIRQRAAALPPSPRALLEAVSLAGEPLLLVAAVQAAGISQAQRVTGELVAEQFLRRRSTGAGETVEPYHGRIGEAVVAGLGAARVRELHGRLAAALEATSGADVERLALHFLGAGDEERGWRYTRQAADEALGALAFERAARLYQELLERSGPDEETAAALQGALADALASCGRYSEAVPHFEAVLRRAGSPSPRGKARLGLSLLGSLAGIQYGLHLHQGRRQPTAAEVQILRARYQATLSLVYVDPMRMFAEAMRLQQQLCQLDVNLVPAGAEMWCFVSAVMSFSGFSFKLARLTLRRLEAAARDPQLRRTVDYRFSAMVLAFAEGQWAEVEELDARWIERRLDRGRYWHVSSYLLYYAMLRLGQDRYEEAQQVIDRLYGVADSYGYHNVAGAYARFLEVNLLVRRRDLGAGEEAITGGLDYHVKIGMSGPQILFLSARARVRTLRGLLEEAQADLDAAGAIAEAQSPVPPHYTAVYWLARVALAQERWRGTRRGDHGADARQARQAAAAALKQGRKNAETYAFVRAETYALVAAQEGLCGRLHAARGWIQRATDEARRLGSPVDEARAQVTLARLLLEAGEEQAAPAAAEANALLERAEPLLAAARLAWDLEQLRALRQRADAL